jgi:tetratricopeptide (TPR) repeat protein
LFQQAIAKDPQYAAAYAGLADTYAFQAVELTPQISLSKAREFSEKALQIDPDLAEAHATLGLIAPHFGWDWQQAQRHFERAIQLNPNYATAHQWYAEVYFATTGRMDDAISEMRQARLLDPLSPIIATDLGKMLYFARRYDEAISELHRALEIDSDFPVAHWLLLCSYVEKRDYTRAYRSIPSRRESSEVGTEFALAYIDAHAGKREQARIHLAKVIAYEKHTWFDPAAIAAVYVALGEKDEAFRWLGRGVETGAASLNALKVSPDWDPIRSEPEFQGLLQKLHLR